MTDDAHHRIRKLEHQLAAERKTVERMTRLIVILREVAGEEIYAHALVRLASEKRRREL